jgi:hypothetical protein
VAWIQREQNAWSWLLGRSWGAHDAAIRQALNQLNHAQSQANDAERYRASNPQHYAQIVQSIPSYVTDVFVQRKLPHTSSPLFKRIESYRSEAGDLAATFFASVHVPPPQGHHPQPQELQAWRGLVEGLLDRYPPASSVMSKLQANEASFEELRSRCEALIGEKSTTLDALHRHFQASADSIAAASSSQTTDFTTAQSERSEQFNSLLREHTTALEKLRRAFREEMALRAPAEYWSSKRTTHLWIAGITGLISFLSIAACGWFLAQEIQSLLAASASGSAPESWKVATLALVSLFAVWAVRLVVRLFLSHTHLATDASERVVMLKTYMSLLEGDRLSSPEDRQLILQALFRPASDGIVKDEGVPSSLMEYFTRSPRV